MKGTQVYDNNYISLINKVINNSTYNELLIGFKNASTKLSVSSIYRYINHINNFLLSIDYKYGNEITFDEYTNYLDNISQKTPSYQIQVYSALKKFSKYLYRSKRTSEDIMQNIDRPIFYEKEETIAKRNKAFLTKEETVYYISCVKNGVGSKKQKSFMKKETERDLAIIEIFLNTGMRCSGLYKLDISNLNLDNGKLITTEKGNKVKEYTLSPEIIPDIKKWIIKRNELLNNHTEEALFLSREGKRLSVRSISNLVNKYAIDIDDKNITPHKLRATFGTTLLNETGDIYFTQEAMGHQDPKTTELYMRGQNEKNQKKVANIMSNIFIN